MSGDFDVPELDRPLNTVYRGEREAELSSTYTGEDGELQEYFHPGVYISEPDDFEYSLLPRKELVNAHPNTFFEWGYNGEGPRMLSASLLADAYDDDEFAYEHRHDFLDEIGSLERNEAWSFSAKNIDDFMKEIR